MSYLLLGAGFVVLAWAIIASALNAQSSTLVRVIKITLGLLVVAAMIALLITGRYRLAISLLPVLLLTAIRWHRMISTLQNTFSGYSSMTGRATPGQASDVTSPYLRMILDHDSGAMAGEVLQGMFAGRGLDTLDLGDLLALLGELQQHDKDGARLLTAWLDRSQHADSWREAAQGHGRAHAGSSGGMSRQEAAEILGVAPDADAATIKAAYHNLMAANHPDKGGSPWLARQINLARDALLNE
jgi:hypothetical protein